MNNSNGSEVPTLSLYFVIIDEIIFGPSCDVWAMSFPLRTATMVAAIVLLIIYVYVVAVIIKNFKKLNNPFYICVLSMSVCDFIILLTSMQGEVPCFYRSDGSLFEVKCEQLVLIYVQ
jgi:hypothetical protein